MKKNKKQARQVPAVLGTKIFTELEPEDVRDWYSTHHDNQNLAYLFELVHREYVFADDETYDYEVGSEEYLRAREKSTAWRKLYEEYEQEIITILENKKVEISARKRIEVLDDFMSFYGFAYSGGWWIQKKNK